MANRYFIASGATANWNDINSWSETSGGAVGATVPTSADNAIFDANSLSAPCNLTINAEANCLDLDFSGLDNLLTLTNSAFNLNVYGNLTLTSNTYLATTFSGAGYLQLRATTSVNITSNGCTRYWNYLKINGIGGTFNFVDDWYSTAIFNPQNGTINLGSYSHFFGQVRYNTGVAVLNAQSSTITTQQFWNDGGTSFTFNAGTSTFRITFVNSTSFTFYNLEYVSNRVEVWGNQTVLNNFICNGTNGTTNRLLIHSVTLGTPRTITVNGSIIASNVDFRDITLAGTANRDLSAITGGSGDCGGNSGITFTPAQKQYFKHTSGAVNFSDITKWFSDFSPRTTTGRVPLPQDDWDMDESSFTGTSTVNVNCPRIGRSCDMSRVNQSVTWSLANNIDVYGSYVLGSNITQSGNFTLVLLGRDSQDYIFKPYNKFLNLVSFVQVNSKYTFQSDSTSNAYSFGVSNALASQGIVDFNDYNVKGNIGWFANNYERSIIYFGNGIVEFLNDYRVHPNMTIYSEGSTLKCAPISGAYNIGASLGGKIYNKVQFSGAHAGNFDIAGSNTINELIIDSGRKVRLTNGTTQTIGKITSNGTLNNKVTIQSTTAGSQATINYTGLDTPFIPNVVLKDINFSVPVYALNGTNLGNNTNVKYVWKVAKKTMGFPIRLVKDE